MGRGKREVAERGGGEEVAERGGGGGSDAFFFFLSRWPCAHVVLVFGDSANKLYCSVQAIFVREPR